MPEGLGADSIKRYHLTSIGNPIVEIRRSYDRLISTMGFPILVRWHLYIESEVGISPASLLMAGSSTHYDVIKWKHIPHYCPDVRESPHEGTITLKRKCRHFDEIFITGCTESCQNDNFQCSQWWKFHQNDDIFVSVNANLWCFFAVSRQKPVEQTLDWPIIRDTITVIWPRRNAQ